jgi:hypothetical protein
MTSPKQLLAFMFGAVDFEECAWGCNKCHHGKCKICGFNKHCAVHGPVYDELPGGKPYDHEFEPTDSGRFND